MNLKKKLIPVLIAPLFVGLTFSGQALANDSDELEKLRQLVQELDQKVKILDRKGELAEEAAIEKKKVTPIVQTEDGFGFKSGDGKNAIYLNGRVQADYHSFGKSDAQNADTFDLRRAYLTIQGKVYEDYDFKITGDFAQQSNVYGTDVGTATTTASGSPLVYKTTLAGSKQANKTILDEAYFGINWWKEARFRFGQFNMPFGLENYTSDLFNDFTERSLTEALTPSKERGAMVHGNPIPGVYYGLALSTGRGKNADNTDVQVDSPEVIGRATVNLAKFAKLDETVLHVGGSFSHGYISENQGTNYQNALSSSVDYFLPGQGNAASKTEGNGLTFFTPSPFYTGAGQDIERTRLAAEAAIAFGQLKLQSEYITHNYKGLGGTSAPAGTTLATTAFDKDINAWYVSANWLVTGETYADSYLADGTWGRIKPKHNFSLKDGHIGAVVLGARFSEYDASDFKHGEVGGVAYASTTSGPGYNVSTPDGAHSWTIGATWLLNPNTRLAINYIDTKFEDGVLLVKDDRGNVLGTTNGEKALTLRGQYDF